MSEYIKSCVDCVHYEPCKEWVVDCFGENTAFPYESYEKPCAHFKYTEDVAPVVHGRWEFIGDDYANCTYCGTIFDSRPTPYFFKSNNKFCRNCGAKMDLEVK